MRNQATRAVATRRERFFFRTVARVSRVYLEMYGNFSYEIDLNGELRVLTALAALSPRCVFDVGANIGDWTFTAVGMFPQARIHAFEIVPATARLMQERVEQAGISTVTVNAAGLSDSQGVVTVSYLPGFSAGATASMSDREGDVELRDCPVLVGDKYCQEHRIEHIDFLKIDVEGFESKVLEGFDLMLGRAAIDVVQFEYGRVNATLRVLLGDLYDRLEGHGYAVGKIFPDGVDFRAYDAWVDEDFRGPNFLAVHRERPDLINSVAVSARAQR
jgi:FkbM family methyltransferase